VPGTHVLDPAQNTIKRCIIKKNATNGEWLAWMNEWELTKEENGWDEIPTNLINLNVHFPICSIVILKIKHAEECTIILRVLCWHGDIRKSPVWNIREWRSSRHLKNIVKPCTDFDRNGYVILVVVILLFPVLRIQNFNLLVDFVDTIHSPMCIIEHMYEYLLEKLLSCKKLTYKWIAKSALEYNNGKKWLTREAWIRSSTLYHMRMYFSNCLSFSCSNIEICKNKKIVRWPEGVKMTEWVK
jgi:hypothetical protein